MLTPDLYDALEGEASAEFPLPVLSAFLPLTYHQTGVPTRVRWERELIRYVDHNFEAEVPEFYRPGATFPQACYVNAFTNDEKRAVDDVRGVVGDLTSRLFGRSVLPMSNLLVQVAPFRILTELARVTGMPKLSIYEAGPGLGYLGALLARAGHQYTSFDVTQGMYLWQNRLLNEVCGGELTEGALVSGALRLDVSRVVHLPWWRHVETFGRSPMACDIVYSNSNLCEMTRLAFRLLVRGALPLLRGSPLGLFVFMSWGYPGQVLPETAHEEFVRSGYRRVQNLPFKAYAPAERDTSEIERAFANGIPFYDPSGEGEPRIDASAMVAVRRAEAAPDVDFTHRVFGWDPPFLD